MFTISEILQFPISRDPPEGGTIKEQMTVLKLNQDMFPISRDPPGGGT